MSTDRIVSPLVVTKDIKDAQFDAVVVVTDRIDRLTGPLQCLKGTLAQQNQVDDAFDKQPSVITCDELPGKRIIYAPTGPVTRDYDDVRRYQEAADKGIKRALAAGCKAPLVAIPQQEERYPLAARVTFLGALHALYTPLEVREMRPEKAQKAEKIGIWITEGSTDEAKILDALETGRAVYRDIGGTDPERMAPPRVAEYVEQTFQGTCIKVEIISDLPTLEKEYPLLEAVNRASRNVARHTARLIFLEYEGEGPVDTTLMLVGKGICYDTGGADIKAGGVMAGMHRDKCGASFVAGFFKMLSLWKPKGLKVIGSMSMVRNSVGSDCYVADELIVSRAGVRVRVGNTDAEGRMVMADVLCRMKERAANEVNPYLFTIATLTGHVIRAYGPSYAAILENGPAKKASIGQKVQDAGETCGDPFEISSIRRDDYEAHQGPSEYEDVLQCNNKPSTMTNRGHQNPAAFLIMASGLDKHGSDSSNPLPYSHVDIAGSSGPFPGVPTGSPIVAMAHAFVLNRPSGA